MFEALLAMSIVCACMYMPLRGKTYQQLSLGQQKRVEKNYNQYMRTRKGMQTPNMTIEDYMPIVQKQGMTYLIMAIVLLPIYVLIVMYLYSSMF